MEEDLSVRAIIIGVGVLIAIATITAIIAYYGSAKEVAQSMGTGPRYDVKYRQDIETTLVKTNPGEYVSGQEVINLINYFRNESGVKINISKMKVVTNVNANYSVTTIDTIENINNTLNDNLASFYSIRPEYAFSLSIDERSNELVISLVGKEDKGV